MRYLKAFTLGGLAVGVLLGAVVAMVAAVATTGAISDLRLAFGPVVLIAVRRNPSGTCRSTDSPRRRRPLRKLFSCIRRREPGTGK